MCQHTALHLREIDDGYRIMRDSTKEEGSKEKAVRREKPEVRHQEYHLEHGELDGEGTLGGECHGAHEGHHHARSRDEVEGRQSQRTRK